MIFEINDENAPSLESNFTNEMMIKYGQTIKIYKDSQNDTSQLEMAIKN